MLVLQVDCGDMRNVDNFCIAGKVGKVNFVGAVGRLWQHEKSGNFGIADKVGKVSTVGALG